MKIELKNLKVNLAFSEETIMFKADVYVDGVKTAYAHNDGRGGCTCYFPYEGKRDLLNKAEVYAESLPSTYYNHYEIKSNLEFVIDTLVADEEKKKEEKKILKLTENHIVWGIPKGNEYNKIAFKGRPKFADLMKVKGGKETVYKLLDQIKSELKNGEVIFNKNL